MSVELRSELNPEDGAILGLLGTEDMVDEVVPFQEPPFLKDVEDVKD